MCRGREGGGSARKSECCAMGCSRRAAPNLGREMEFKSLKAKSPCVAGGHCQQWGGLVERKRASPVGSFVPVGNVLGSRWSVGVDHDFSTA